MSANRDLFLAKYQSLVPPEHWEDFQSYFDKPLRKSLRVNTTKISVTDFQKLAESSGWELTPVSWCPTGFFIERVDRSTPLGSSWQHLAGLFYIQEASSMLPVEKIVATQPAYILDLCSAPGSKLTQLAGKFPESIIIANEVDRKRAIPLQQNIVRQGLTNVIVTSLDPNYFADKLPEFFSVIVLDAPCSGEGMIRKDPKVLEFWSEKKIKYMAGIQKRISQAAYRTLAPGGELIYSTCTYAPEENEDILALLTSTNSDLKLETEQKIWPYEFDTEGFFVASLLKQAGARRNRQVPRTPKATLAKSAQLLSPWQIELPETFTNYELWNEDQVLILRPNICRVLPFRSLLAGLELGKLIRNELILSHAAAIALGHLAQANFLELTDPVELTKFLKGQDLQNPLDKETRGQIIMRYLGFPLGLAKVVGDKLKNQLPRENRRS